MRIWSLCPSKRRPMTLLMKPQVINLPWRNVTPHVDFVMNCGVREGVVGTLTAYTCVDYPRGRGAVVCIRYPGLVFGF